MTWLMDEADVCRTSSRASRRPLDVISTVAILDPRWRGRKWRHPGPGAVFSSPIVAVAQDGGPSASARHLGWPHLREPEMRSSKMATGSGRAAILRHRHNGARKNRPILLLSFWCVVSQGSWCQWMFYIFKVWMACHIMLPSHLQSFDHWCGAKPFASFDCHEVLNYGIMM